MHYLNINKIYSLLQYWRLKLYVLLFDKKQLCDWKSTIIELSEYKELRGDVCIFSHFNALGKITLGAVHQLRQLKACGFSVIFVSTSAMNNSDELDELKSLVDVLIIRINVGYDFGSWATGLMFANYGYGLNRLILLNDSVIGPLVPLGELLSSRTSAENDLWGITANTEILWHVQSYFFCFEKKAIDSKILPIFFSKVGVHKHKKSIIVLYEVGMSLLAKKLKLRIGTIISQEDILKTLPRHIYRLLGFPDLKLNPIIRCVDHLIKCHRLPYIKREFIERNPYNVSLYNVRKYIGGCDEITPQDKLKIFLLCDKKSASL
jgi:lipopolysaccharide biosynthesis protein